MLQVAVLRGVGDYITAKNPAETGEQKDRLRKGNLSDSLFLNKTPDRLREKIKILEEIKRNSRRNNRIQ